MQFRGWSFRLFLFIIRRFHWPLTLTHTCHHSSCVSGCFPSIPISTRRYFPLTFGPLINEFNVLNKSQRASFSNNMTDLLRMPYKKHDLPLAWLLSCQCVRSGWCYSGVQNQSTCRHLHNSNSLLKRFTASMLRHRDVAHDATRLIILVQVATIQHDILEKYKFPTYFRSWMSSSVIISSAWWLFRWGFWWEGGWKPRALAGNSILVTSAFFIVALQYFSLPWEVWHSFPVGLKFPLFRTLLILFSIRARPFGQIIHTTKRNPKYLSSWPFKRSACILSNWTYWPDVNLNRSHR